ncbi:MAG: TfoX/Sxy family protein [Saprospiraceae bacterium]
MDRSSLIGIYELRFRIYEYLKQGTYIYQLKNKQMAFSEDYLQFVLINWNPLVKSCIKMFGGVGIYKDGVMFAGIMGGSLHFKVDDLNRQDFIDVGMEPFFHKGMGKGMASYYLIPENILEDKDALKKWAENAFAAALRKKK